jgi:propionyl-CoA carboxylase alpha chain
VSQRFSSLLVANRGEIARRVFRTARSMGLRCVAVYVDADALSPHVTEADEAVRLPDGGYLDGPAVLDAARRAGAEAIHPGYGFLSENAAFAASVGDAGLVWVGPSPEVIEAMGDKIAAKRAATDAGVPTLPSSEDPSAGGEVGYPLLVKAAAGGGGKGMRIVETAADLDAAVAAARREAASGFGDDRVFLERYVPRSRHVEIQVLGDSHGDRVHLGERECSIQRRHQKIIEESPSPVVDEAMRAAMGDAALRLAAAIDYQSAGTVEFLVDDATREFFFLEVNTRLQVEHPVTEAVTGLDLVREQLRVAAGEPLGYGQEDITFGGHAIEARLYAEDPAAGFLPATGTLDAFEPAPEPLVRWDSGVVQGSVVGLGFDPMLAKVVAHAPTRTEAAGRLALALERLHVAGVTTNRDFLAATLRHSEFLGGATTTDFIDRAAPPPALELTDDELDRVATLAALWIQGRNRAEATVLRTVPSGWRNARLPAERIAFTRGDQAVEVRYRARRDGSFQVGDGGTARLHGWGTVWLDAEVDGHRTRCRVTESGERLHVQVPGGTVTLDVVPRFPLRSAERTAGGLEAPMPGVVLEVRAAQGDEVTARQVLVVLEAMKMEHHVLAPEDGVVREVNVAEGQQVENGELLLVVDPHEPSES